MFFPLFFSLLTLLLSASSFLFFPYLKVKYSASYYPFSDVDKDELGNEKIEQAIVTICETLKALRYVSGCYSGDFDEVMGFLRQGISYEGTFEDLSLLQRSNTFSCAQADEFGRFLLFRVLSDYEVQNFGYRVEPLGLDPCGITDFVYRR